MEYVGRIPLVKRKRKKPWRRETKLALGLTLWSLTFAIVEGVLLLEYIGGGDHLGVVLATVGIIWFTVGVIFWRRKPIWVQGWYWYWIIFRLLYEEDQRD